MSADLLESFRREGRTARKAGFPAKACPYGMDKACTAIEVKAHIKARKAWMEGWREVDTK